LRRGCGGKQGLLFALYDASIPFQFAGQIVRGRWIPNAVYGGWSYLLGYIGRVSANPTQVEVTESEDTLAFVMYVVFPFLFGMEYLQASRANPLMAPSGLSRLALSFSNRLFEALSANS